MNFQKKYNVIALCSQLHQYLNNNDSGVVHSVFSSTINLQLDNHIVNIASGNRFLMPFGMQLEDTVDFSSISISADDLCLVNHSTLEIHSGSHVILFDFTEAKPMDLTCYNHPVKWNQNVILDHLNQLESAIAAYPLSADGIAPVLPTLFPNWRHPIKENVWSQFLAPRIATLYEALAQKDSLLLSAAASKIAGCGPGLTPSSDDFACGIMTFGFGAEGSGFGDYANTIASGMMLKTNQISASHLAHSALGMFSTGMLAFVETFFRDSASDRLLATIRDILKYGSTSGADLLSGFWFAGACKLSYPIHTIETTRDTLD